MFYPMIDMKATGRNIKKIMQQRRLAVKDVQAYLNLATPQSIYHWLGGRSMPTIDNLYALSELFGVSIDEVIVGDKKGSPAACYEDLREHIVLYCFLRRANRVLYYKYND